MSVRFTTAGGLRRSANLPPWNGMTLCGWAARNADRATYSSVAGFADAGPSTEIMYIFAGDGDTLEGYTSVAGEIQFVPTKQPANDVPFFWAFVINGSGTDTVTMYYREALDGAFTTILLTGPSVWTPADLAVGDNPFSEWLDGAVEHVKCWDVPLNATQIGQEFNSSTPVNTGSLNFYWPCTNTGDINDLSGNGRNPTVSGTIVDDITLFPFGAPPSNETGHWPFGRRNARPGRGPYSRMWRKNRILRPPVEVSEKFPEIIPPRILADIGSNRPRVGRSPYSLGKFFRPKVEGFSTTQQNSNSTQAGVLSFVGTLQKQVNRALTGSISPAATLTSSSVRFAVFSATLDFVGAIQKTTTKVHNASLSFAGGLVKATSKLHSAVLTFNGLLSTGGTTYSQPLTAALSFAGTLVKQTGKVLAGAITPIGALVKQTQRLLTGTLSFAGSLVKQARKLPAAVLSFVGTLATSWQRSVVLSAAVSFIGVVTSQPVVIINTIADMWRKAWTGIWRDINQPKDGP